MPRTGGIYAVPSGTKGVTLQTIQSGKYNGFLDDLTVDLNAARPITAGGTGASTADGAAASLGLVSAKDLAGVNTVSGTANAITIATDRVYTAYADTVYLSFRALEDIDPGGVTIDLDGLGAKSVYKTVAAGLVDVNRGDIIAGGYYLMTFDPVADGGDGAFVLLNPSTASAAFKVGDMLRSARDLTGDWLKCDGALYDVDDYPELSLILPPLSDDAIWTNITNPSAATDYEIVSTSFGFLMGEDQGTNSRILRSVDGNTWTVAATLTSFRIRRLAQNGSIYLAADGFAKLSLSNDGSSWGTPFVPTGFTGGSDAILGSAFGAGLFVITGTGGKISTSPDGSTWTARSSGISTAINDVKFINNIFVAVGSAGRILTSPNGITWTSRTSGTTTNLNGVTFGAGTYVAVGGLTPTQNAVIVSSPDLITWTSRGTVTTTALYNVEYSSAGFLAVGDTGVARLSKTGISWSATPTGVTNTLRGVTFDPNQPTRYLVCGASGRIMQGIRTLPTQFQVPNFDHTYDWIKAVS
ncbi:hypothetical protein DEM27_05645 [Metarhizobium album]|uniref:Uncharacterized protein n=1 Tax=Metarhizobium album TaxID=2182425 RepID=A0A2U2DUX8_9HYPH|nr:hypothetical protein [Rhizobium album]PWE57125.1 hypothetical protein DEM27_05645 [Rhizobium album]